MGVPDYQSFMRPVLESLADGQERSVRDIAETSAASMRLSEGDRAERISSGQARWYNRLNWAVTYLMEARTVERVRRGVYRITDRGRNLLARRPTAIDNSDLERYPEFIEFLNRSQSPPNGISESSTVTVPTPASLTPDERMDAAYDEMRSALAGELLARIRGASPGFFERLVIDLLVAMGYGGSLDDAAEITGGSGDRGIDGTIKQDRLGLDMVYIQAKRWQQPVGRPELQAFAGSLGGERASKGIFITASSFTPHAREFVLRSDKRIVLVDGPSLAALMIDHGVGVSLARTYRVSKVDSDYFDEEPQVNSVGRSGSVAKDSLTPPPAQT